MKRNTVYSELKRENRNRVFNKIREARCISRPALAYELQLSLPTVTQNLTELKDLGYIFENGSFGDTGGRRAKAYSIISKSKIVVGMDITKNHISIILVDLLGIIIYKNKINYTFSRSDAYLEKLAELVETALYEQKIDKSIVLGISIALPGLITDNFEKIFYGKILDFTGLTVQEIGRYISHPCRLYNDADAAGYAEISQRQELTDAFYISLSNNIGGAVLINHKVYKGEGSRSGEVGHITIIPNGRECYCGQRGCFETYCNAAVLTSTTDGDLDVFFENLARNDEDAIRIWNEYLHYLSIAVNNVRMLFDCKVILGGYVGPYLEKYLEDLKDIVAKRNTFETNADYLTVGIVKEEALAFGSALPFIHECWKNV